MSDKFVVFASLAVILLLLASSPFFAFQSFGLSALSSISSILLLFFGLLAFLVSSPIFLILALFLFYKNQKQVSSLFGGNLALWCIAAVLIILAAL